MDVHIPGRFLQDEDVHPILKALGLTYNVVRHDIIDVCTIIEDVHYLRNGDNGERFVKHPK